MNPIVRSVDAGRAVLAVLLGTVTVLSGAALLATSGALITGAARRPESLLVLLPLITCVRLFSLTRAAGRYAERLVSHDLTLRMSGRLRRELLERLVPLSPAALTGRRGGELLARVRADVDELQGLMTALVLPAGVAVLAGGTAVLAAALLSGELAVAVAALLIGLGVAVPLWARVAGGTPSVRTAEADAAFGADTLDLVRGLPVHLSGDGGRGVRARLLLRVRQQQQAEHTAAAVAASTTLAREAAPGLGVLAALWFVGGQLGSGTNPVLLAAATLGVLGAVDAVSGLGRAWASAAGLAAAGRRVRALSQEQPAVRDPERPAALPATADLQLEAVSFRYPGAAHPVLTDLDLRIDAGAKVALIGASGAGKSTVLALLMRWWDVERGQIRIGGTDLRRLRLTDLRRRFGWAGQDPQLFAGSLAANLLVGRPEATPTQVAEAFAAVGWTGARTEEWIGEAGAGLSAGERARVAVARALLSPAPVLLLDEPVEHLDETSAITLLSRLAGEPRTVIIVTHRPELLDERWRQARIAAPRRFREPTS